MLLHFSIDGFFIRNGGVSIMGMMTRPQDGSPGPGRFGWNFWEFSAPLVDGMTSNMTMTMT